MSEGVVGFGGMAAFAVPLLVDSTDEDINEWSQPTQMSAIDAAAAIKTIDFMNVLAIITFCRLSQKQSESSCSEQSAINAPIHADGAASISSMRASKFSSPSDHSLRRSTGNTFSMRRTQSRSLRTLSVV